MKKEEEKQFNQLFNNEEHCEELNIIRYNVLKFIDENYISKVEVLEEIDKVIEQHIVKSQPLCEQNILLKLIKAKLLKH